jgi:hypothetical protein
MTPLTWAIIGAGLLSAYFYRMSKGPSFKGFFAGDDEDENV